MMDSLNIFKTTSLSRYNSPHIASTTTMLTKEVTFPVTLAKFPYPRRINPFYEEVGPETDVWVQNFKPFDKPEVMQAFLRCDFRASFTHTTASN